MVRGPVTAGALALLGSGGIAVAGPKRKVQIDTKPVGATVYLNAKEDGPVCKATPCAFDAPIGSTTLIVELAGHKALLEELNVPKSTGVAPLKINYTLEVAKGSVTLKGPAGAMVKVDGVEKGKVPQSLDLAVNEAHEVEWVIGGKVVDSQVVSVEDGEDVTLEGKSSKTVAVVDKPKTGNNGNGDDVTGPSITKPGTPVPRGPVIAVGLSFTVGFRDFTYEQPTSDNLIGTEKERGQLLAGPVVEIWPGTLFGVKPLKGLAMLLRYGHGLNQQVVLDNRNNPTTARTFWRSFEASVRNRWTIGSSATVEVGAGYVRDQHQFEGDLQADIDRVPDADYPAVKIGGRLSLLAGAFEPFVSFENRFVMTGIGQLQTRFSRADATGLRAGVGAALRVGKMSALVEGALTRYSWTFTSDPVNDMFSAPGAADTIKFVSFQLGYAY